MKKTKNRIFFSFTKYILLIALAGFSLTGCALLKKNHNANSSSANNLVVDVSAEADNRKAPSLKTDAGSSPALENQVLINQTDLEFAPNSLTIYLNQANVLVSSDRTLKKNKIKVTLIKGKPSCGVEFKNQEGNLTLTEPREGESFFSRFKKSHKIPSGFGCLYLVEVVLKKETALKIDLVRAEIEVAHFNNAPIDIHLKWGDVDLAEVGPVNVQCEHCMLSGEAVNGPVTYNIEQGNVGLAGLTDSVVGSTNGDVILKWKKISATTQAKIISKAGDVVVMVPPQAKPWPTVQCQRGDISSNYFDVKDLPSLQQSSFQVTAELGNVRFYRYQEVSQQ